MIDFTYDDFITGEKFQSIAEFIFLPNSALPNKDCIIFCKTDYLNECVPLIEKSNNTYILISHNSDGNIVSENPREFDYCFTHFPKNIKYWFAQNLKNLNHSNLVSIPIGLENEQWFPDIKKKTWILESIQNGSIYNKREKVLYINHNVGTNYLERKEPYKIYHTNDWCTVVNGFNGYEFLKYRNDLLNHKYVLCPEGNGLDTHRIWEALLLGCIPIVKENTYSNSFNAIFDFYKFNNYSMLTYESLNTGYSNNIDKHFKFLKFSFWKDLILRS